MQIYSSGEKSYMPIAFAASLTTDPAAVTAFFRMTPAQQDDMIACARRLKTQEEMDNLLHGMVR